MKKFLLSILMLLTVGFAFAQTPTITGNVRDQQGDPLHFAFIQNEAKQGIYTDSLGNFSIAAAANSTLRINCNGYHDTTVIAKNDMRIVLSTIVNVSASKANVVANSNDATRQVVKNSLGDAMSLNSGNYSVQTQFDAAQGAIMPAFTPKEETQGSRYLLKGWSHGYVVNAKGETIQNPTFMFAYDKMGGALLLTKDQKSAVEIDRDLVKTFTVYDNVNNAYTFANVPQINPTHYVELISDGKKYKIYKEIKTSFEKDNYSTDGVMTQGHNYDLYTDVETYYVLNVQTNDLKKIALKKKALKETFSADADKVNKFMSDHSSDTIDDTYLAGLGEYINE